MIDILSIKQAIIDQATSGKLSKHFESDVDIKLLISVLPAPTSRREKLLKQKSEIEDELFEIPSYWAWVKLGEISSYGDTPIKTMVNDLNVNTWVLELEDIDVGGKIIRKTRVETRKPIGEKTVFRNGQLLYSKLRPYLKKVLVADEDGVSTPELICFDVFCGINTKYIKLCLTNSWVDKVVNKRAYGIKMPRVDAGFMVNLPIPLPPIEEQNRIVDKVEEILAVLDHIDSLQSQYAINVEVLKSKLIDAGIRGKLTEQLPEDGNADDLYAEIKTKKRLLIESGVLKNKKKINLPSIETDKLPFDIPQNWKWIQVGDIVEVFGRIGFRGYTKNDIVESHCGAITISPSNIIGNGKTDFADCTYLSWEKYNESPEIMIENNDILVVKTGSSYGKTGIVTELPEKATINPQIAVLKYVLCIPGFLNYVMNSTLAKRQFEEFVVGAAIPTFSQEKLASLIMPLPPLPEQKRIVEKLETLLE